MLSILVVSLFVQTLIFIVELGIVCIVLHPICNKCALKLFLFSILCYGLFPLFVGERGCFISI